MYVHARVLPPTRSDTRLIVFFIFIIEFKG